MTQRQHTRATALKTLQNIHLGIKDRIPSGETKKNLEEAGGTRRRNQEEHGRTWRNRSNHLERKEPREFRWSQEKVGGTTKLEQRVQNPRFGLMKDSSRRCNSSRRLEERTDVHFQQVPNRTLTTPIRASAEATLAMFFL